MSPDPIAYGPTGYRCGCGKDAHSNLTPCNCGDFNDGEWCELEPGHDGDHRNDTVTWPATASA